MRFNSDPHGTFPSTGSISVTETGFTCACAYGGAIITGRDLSSAQD